MTSYEQIQSIYDRIPQLECRQQCGRHFCAPVDCSHTEATVIAQFLKRPSLPQTDHPVCPCLDPVTFTCHIYPVRPLICRLWGTVKCLRCPFGCEPDRWLSDEEAATMISQLNLLGGGLGRGFASLKFLRRYGPGPWHHHLKPIQ